MHGDPGEIIGHHLALARMDTSADLEPESARADADRQRAPNRSGRAIERRQHAIARPLHQPTAEVRKLSLDHTLVLPEQLPPSAIPKLSCTVCRSNDVVEENCRQDSVTDRGRGPSRDELLRSEE